MAAKRLFFLSILLSLVACTKDEPLLETEAGEKYSGGENFTTFDFSENAFGVQGRNLSREDENLFVAGNALFRTNWVTAPASVQSLDGLGPVFNAISCGSCHFKDGRAEPPLSPDEPLNGLLFRLSVTAPGQHGQTLGDPVYGLQLQDKAILGVRQEASVHVNYREISGTYADGSIYTLREPDYEFYDLRFGDFAADLHFSPRIAQQIPGLGLLENIPESNILALADEQDADGDGISGRPNYVWDKVKQSVALGRFGWKANQPHLRQQTADAFNGDIGITSSINPQDHLTDTQREALQDVPNGGEPELSDDQLDRVVRYLETLAVPGRRNVDDAQVLQGKAMFHQLQCATCHQPKMETAANGPIPALNNQTIYPYTDLLLHDMGPGLADNRPDFLASGTEWRTPPLWGIGLIATVNGHTTLLHDGRARNLEEAILWHGGEAEAAQKAFTQLAASEREALIRFLESL
ncbi:di-heme oxidoreductase family protein [Flavilitoribacter nigricans]|nr:di-heme oxidoredictase family protein [Flavilitoribacter nigricans]